MTRIGKQAAVQGVASVAPSAPKTVDEIKDQLRATLNILQDLLREPKLGTVWINHALAMKGHQAILNSDWQPAALVLVEGRVMLSATESKEPARGVTEVLGLDWSLTGLEALGAVTEKALLAVSITLENYHAELAVVAARSNAAAKVGQRALDAAEQAAVTIFRNKVGELNETMKRPAIKAAISHLNLQAVPLDATLLQGKGLEGVKMGDAVSLAIDTDCIRVLTGRKRYKLGDVFDQLWQLAPAELSAALISVQKLIKQAEEYANGQALAVISNAKQLQGEQG